MAASGPKRPSRDISFMTAFGGKADISQRFAEPSRFMSARSNARVAR